MRNEKSFKNKYYAPVAVPNTPDCQNDTLDEKTISRISQKFIQKKGDNIDFNHCTEENVPCWEVGQGKRSIIVPHNMEVKKLLNDETVFLKKGSWVLEINVDDESALKIEKGEYSGVSLSTEPFEEEDKYPAENNYSLLRDNWEVTKVSLVRKPCVREAVFLDPVDFISQINNTNSNIKKSDKMSDKSLLEKLKMLIQEENNIEKSEEVEENNEENEDRCKILSQKLKECQEKNKNSDNEEERADSLEKSDESTAPAKGLQKSDEHTVQLNQIIEKSDELTNRLDSMANNLKELQQEFNNFKKNKNSSKVMASLQKSDNTESIYDYGVPGRDGLGRRIKE